MSFWQKLRAGLARMMIGRNGADELSLAMLILGLILSFISGITRFVLLDLAGMALYIYSIFRMFSRNVGKRRAENQRFVGAWSRCVSSVKQFTVRLKNQKNYKYLKCPQCHARLRLPRKVGEVTLTCGNCKHSFKAKA